MTLGAVHHHGRTGGSPRARRLIVPAAVAATALLTAMARATVVARS